MPKRWEELDLDDNAMKCNLPPRIASFKEAEVGTHKVQGPVNDNIKVDFPKLQ